MFISLLQKDLLAMPKFKEDFDKDLLTDGNTIKKLLNSIDYSHYF